MMGNHARQVPKRRSRVWLIVVPLAVLAVAIAAGVVVLVNKSDNSDPRQRAAQDRCESDVVEQLASPLAAKLSNVESKSSVLDPDSRDLFSLQLNEPLKGVAMSRITVWEVTGVVDAQSEVGTSLHDPFTCRAYFVDNSLADTLVLFDHEH